MNSFWMYLIVALLVIAEWEVCCLTDNSSSEETGYVIGGRVIGGSSAEIKNYPYIVSIQHYNATGNYWYFRCVGSVISADTILTACHCIREWPFTKDHIVFKEPAHVRVLAGVSNRYSAQEAQVAVAQELIPHPQCKNFSTYNTDVATIALDSKLNFSSEVSPVKLFSKNLTAALEDRDRLVGLGTKCVSMGWGLTVAPPSLKSLDILQFTTMHLIDTKKCAELWCQYNHYYCDEDLSKYNYVCALDEHSTMCRGDSGGPLICNDYLFGIDNLGDDRCRFELPTIFADTEPILYFVNKFQ